MSGDFALLNNTSSVQNRHLCPALGAAYDPRNVTKSSGQISCLFRVVVLEKCGHVPQEEMPEQVVSEMKKFMEEPRH